MLICASDCHATNDTETPFHSKAAYNRLYMQAAFESVDSESLEKIILFDRMTQISSMSSVLSVLQMRSVSGYMRSFIII